MSAAFQHTYIPSNALSISFCVGKGLFLRRVYMDITIPGVQNPHWEPWDFAIRSYTRETHFKQTHESMITGVIK